MPSVCPHCGAAMAKVECEACSGYGRRGHFLNEKERERMRALGRPDIVHIRYSDKCTACHGTGRVLRCDCEEKP